MSAELAERLTHRLRSARRALLLGVGGGNDAVSALMMRAQLERDFGFAPEVADIAAGRRRRRKPGPFSGFVSPEEPCGCRRCVRGLRIRVSDVLDRLADGLTPEQVIAELPDLELADVTACLKRTC